MLGLALVAMLAFSAFSAGAASATLAPRWAVNGLYLTATKSFTATNTSEVKLNNASRNLVITSAPGSCTESGEIQGSPEGFSSSARSNVVLTCKNLKTIISGKDRTTLCPVNSVGSEAGTIKTNTLKSTLVWKNEVGGAAGDLLAPASGANLASIEIKGATCPLATGATPLKLTNGLIDSILPVEEESGSGSLSFPESPILSYWSNAATRAKATIEQMKLGGTAATLSGSFSSALSPTEKFGVSPEAGTKLATVGRWGVNGAYLPAGATEPFKTISSAPMSLLGYRNLNLPECTETGLLVGSNAGTPGSVENVRLTCKGVNTSENKFCEFRTPGQPWGTMASVALGGTLARFQHLPGFSLEMSAATGVWFEMEVQGCNLASTPVGGTEIVRVGSYGEAKTQAMEFIQWGSKMGFYSAPAAFTGSFGISLDSGKAFAAVE